MTHLLILCEFLFFCSLLPLAPACVLFFLVALYHLADYFFVSKLHIRLRPSLFIFFFQPASFGSSASKLGVLRFLGLSSLAMGALFALFLISFPILKEVHYGLFLLLAILFASLIYFRKSEALPNPLYIAQRDLGFVLQSFFKQSVPAKLPLFPRESAHFLSSEYPLLRVTNQFLGEPLFTIRRDLTEKPHIIFVFMESFRAKNVGCLGADLPLSPNFDRLAQSGVLFSNFHSTGTLTFRAAIASLFGVPPAHNWWHANRYARIPLQGLPQALASVGYHNALIQGGAVSFDYGIEFFGAQQYQTILGSREIRQAEVSGSTWGVFDEYLMPYAVNWLSERTTPTFLTLFTITNHHPWISPPNWNPPKETGNHPYLNTYAYSDEALGLLIDELRSKQLLEKSILFIFGDHGQETPEGDPYSGFNCHLKQENVHVPLLIYAEGRLEKPTVVDTLASQVDLLPTVLDIMQLKQPHHSLGKSLVRPSDAPIFFSHPYDSVIHGCRKGDWKFLLDELGESLYNLSEDPTEQNNLIVSQAKIAEELRNETLAYSSTINSLYENRNLSPSTKCNSSVFDSEVLDFSADLRFDDAKLTKVAKNYPNLAKLSLPQCRLITDEGIKFVLQSCPKLEVLNVDGLDELTGAGFTPRSTLTEFHALGCHRFSGWDWLSQLYSLRDLHLESSAVTDEQVIAIAETIHNLRALTLRGMSQITDAGFKALFKANPYMKIVSIQNCPLITDQALLTLHECTTRFVEIIDCPRVTKAAIDLLASAPLRVVR